jgi:predicted YcjX-like family ATPase
MAATSGIQKLKGTWEYVDGERFDDYMKEIVRRFFRNYL